MRLGPRQKVWVAALRSGRYRQIRGSFSSLHGFCCLGVADDLTPPGEETYEQHFQISMQGRQRLVTLNDGLCLSFSEIADELEAAPKKYFQESV